VAAFRLTANRRQVQARQFTVQLVRHAKTRVLGFLLRPTITFALTGYVLRDLVADALSGHMPNRM
jgi:hypothetical protein